MRTQNIFFNPRNNVFIPLIISLLLSLMGIFLLPNPAYFAAISEEAIIELTNKERLKNNLEIVTANQLLAKAAYEKAVAIFASSQFQHDINDKKFSAWIKEAGYEYFYAGENLAIDFATDEGVIKAWLESPSHRKNLLNENFTEIGVAVLSGEFNNNNTTIIVQIFGSPLSGNINNNAINGGLSGISAKAMPAEKNNNYQPANSGPGTQNIQSYARQGLLLTHSAKFSQDNFLKYQNTGQFQLLTNYRLINKGFNKIINNKFFAWNNFVVRGNALALSYKLLLILSLLLILLELSLKPAGLKNKEIK